MGRISMPQGKGSLMHNRREYEMYGKELPSHIHKDHIQENIVSEVDIKQMYQNLFGQAVEEYNSKQKRKDRKIKDYYEQIKKPKLRYRALKGNMKPRAESLTAESEKLPSSRQALNPKGRA